MCRRKTAPILAILLLIQKNSTRKINIHSEKYVTCFGDRQNYSGFPLLSYELLLLKSQV